MQDPKEDKAKVLYEAVSQEYDLGTLEEFKQKLQDPEKRKAFYNGIGNDYALGTYDEFEAKLNLKKKELPESTATDTPLDSEAKNTDGLLATQETGQLVKDLDSGKLDARLKQLKAENKKLEEQDDKSSYGSELLRAFKRGSTRLGRNIAATPEFLYDIFATPQNIIAEKFNIEGLEASSEKFKDYIGVENVVKDYYAGQTEKLLKESEELDNKYIGGITDNFQRGNYSDGFRLLGRSIMESLPTSIGIAMSGGATSTPNLLATTTSVFGADKNEEYKEQNPEMSANERTLKSIGSGLAEGVFSTIGTGRIGVAAKEIMAREGKEEGAKIFKAQIIDMYTEALKKYPIPTAMLGEGIEEAVTTMTQNAIDGKPIMDGVSDAFIVGMGSGGTFGVALEGLKKTSGGKTNPADIQNVEATLEKSETIKEELAQQVLEGDLKPKEAKDIYTNWEEISQGLKAVPEEFTPEQKAKAVDLIKEKKSIEKEIEGKDPNLVETKKARVEEINNELKTISKNEEKASSEKETERTSEAQEITQFNDVNAVKELPRSKYSRNYSDQDNNDSWKSFNDKEGNKYFIGANIRTWGRRENQFELLNEKGENIGGIAIDTNNKDFITGYEFNDSVKVNEEYRRRGLATSMIDYVEDYYKKPYKPTKTVRDEFKAVLDKRKKSNETTPTEDTKPNGDVKPRVESNIQQREDNQVQPAVEPTGSKTEVEVKEYTASDGKNAPKYKVSFNKGALNITDGKGKEPSDPIKRKISDKYANDFDFTKGDFAKIPEGTDINPNEVIAKESNNPAEIALLINDTNTDAYIENNIDYKARIIADHLGNVEKQSYIDFGDENNIGNNMARSYFSKKGEGRPLDTIAQELTEDYGIEITPQDLVDHMELYTGGKNDVYKEFKDNNILPLQRRFSELTGLPANDKYIKKAVDQARAKEKLDTEIQNNYLNHLTHEELLSLSKEYDDYEKSVQKEITPNTSNESRAIPKNTTRDESQSRVQQASKTESKGEKRQEGVNNHNTKVDPSKFEIVQDEKGNKFYKTNEIAKKGISKYIPIEEDIFIDEHGIYRPSAKEKNKMSGIYMNDSAFTKTDNNITSQESTQDRTKGKLHERIQYAKQKTSGPPKKLDAIISDVAKKLKATVIYGKGGRRNSAGTYYSSSALTRITNAGDLDTVAHELGHALDDRHNILGEVSGHVNEIALVKQLKWFRERGGSNPPKGLSKDKKTQYLEREGIAEFIRGYIANPKETKVVAPEFYELFEQTVPKETLDILKGFSNDYLDFANATYGDQILSNVEDSSLEDKKGFKKWLEGFKGEDGKLNITFLDKIKANWTNSMHLPNKAFKFVQELKGNDIKSLKPEQSFEVMSRLFAGINGKLNNAFSKGLFNAENKNIKDSKGNIMNVNYLIDGLDASSEKNLRNEMNDVIKLLIAERTVEYVKKLGRTNSLTGIGGGVKTDLEVAQGHLNELDELQKTNPDKYNRIKEGARRYREFADAGLRYAVEKGRISEEQYQRIKDTNEYYVSLARTKEIVPGEEILPFLNESNKLTSVKEVIKKARGGTDKIKNPYLSLLQNTANFIKEADRNEVMLSFVKPLSELREMGDGSPIDLAQIGRQVPAGNKNTIKVYKDGELQYWQFDNDIYRGLKQLEGLAHHKLLEFIGKPSDLVRFTVTNFPVFAARNAFRDTMARLVISRTRGKVSDLIHSNEDREAFERYGGSQAGFHLTNQEAYKETMSKAIKDITKKGGIILDPRKLNYKTYRKLLERGENLNRVAEYKSAYRKAKREGLDDYNAGLYAAYQARDLMDFAVAGHYMRSINKLIPFSNAAVQSVKRNVKGAQENPGKFALRMALFTVGPQLAFRALVASMGDEEEYEELPDYQRDLFWNFKTPFTGDVWVSLPKPFELGLPSSLIDRGISYSKGKEDAFEGFGYSSYNTLNPFDSYSLTGPFKPLVEATSNYDSFRDREIVPFWEKDKLLELRDGKKYASRVGTALSDAFGFVGSEIDPRKIDHVIKGYTTYFGNTALSLGDIGKEDSRNQFNFTKTGFAKDMPISSSKSVKKAYDIAESIGLGSDKRVKVLKGMVKTYYDLDDKEAKKKISKSIYEYSQKLIPYLEAKRKFKIEEVKLEKATT